MKKLARKFSEKIAIQLQYDEVKQDIIAYGLFAFFQLMVIGTVITVIGLIWHMFYESLTAFICVGLLKKSTGGAHSNSAYACTIISIVMILIFAAASRFLFSFHNYVFNICVSIIIYSTSLIVFIKTVPVDTPNKPITKTEKIKRLRKQSFFILTLYILASLILNYYSSVYLRFINISYSIFLSVVWQTLMLTKYGAQFIKAIDKIFM